MRRRLSPEIISAMRSLPADCDADAEGKKLGVSGTTVRKYRAAATPLAPVVEAAAGGTPPAGPTSSPSPSAPMSPPAPGDLQKALEAAGEATPPPPPGGTQAAPPPAARMPNGMTAEEVAKECTSNVEEICLMAGLVAATKAGAVLELSEIEALRLSAGEREAMMESARRGAPVLYRLCGGVWGGVVSFGLTAFFAVTGRAKQVAAKHPPIPKAPKGPRPADPPAAGAAKEAPKGRTEEAYQEAAARAKAAAAAAGLNFA